MLKADFVNDLRHNYMVAAYEGPEGGFALRMLTENMNDKILPVELRRLDGQAFLYYDISGLQNMEAMYTDRTIDRNAFRLFMWNLHEAIEQARELFLPGDGICFEPSMLFWDLEKQKWKFVYWPERDGQEINEIQKEKERLAEFLVMRIDYEDKGLAETVYRFYEEICAGRLYPEAFLEREKKSVNEKEIEEDTWEEEFGRNRMDEEIRKDEDEDEEEYREYERNLELPGTEKQIEKTDGKKLIAGKFLQALLMILLMLTICFTFFLSRYGQNVMIPGGIVSIILTALFLYLRIKKQKATANEEMQTENPGEFLEECRFLEEEKLYEEIEEENNTRECYSEKTVYMDIQDEKEKKLYGIGKFRKQKISLSHLPCIIGKDKSLANGIISDSSVSRIHARLFMEGENFRMQDMNSTNGTYHNGLRLKPNEKVTLEPEDEVGFGRAQFVYR